MAAKKREQARVWRSKDLACLDLLSACYLKQSFAPHSHETYVIGVIESGAEAFDFQGSKHVASVGSIILLDPGEVHTGSPAHECGWSYRAMYPCKGLMQSASSEALGKSILPHFKSPVVEDRTLAAELTAVIRNLEAGVGSLDGHTMLLQVLGKLIARHGDPDHELKPAQVENRSMCKVLEYIRANCHEPISLTELSEVADLSPFHFLRVFQKTTGLTPHAYCTQVRIECAKCLLGQGRPIGEVAVETGFVDQSHLTKWFKRYVGVTPGQYL